MANYFAERMYLAEKYEQWLKENPNVKDCALNVITYLESIGRLNDDFIPSELVDFNFNVYEILASAKDGWIPVSSGIMPKEYKCIDDETGWYGRSEKVLCSALNEDSGEYEKWIDYTIDGEWQTHEYYEGEELAWQPLPPAYKKEK